MKNVRRPRRLAMAVAALGLALTASGCAYINPVQTHEFYQAGDGTNASLLDGTSMFAGVRNAIVVVQEDGTAVFYATLANYTSEPLTVDLQGTDQEQGTALFSGSYSVPANGVVTIGPEGEETVTSENAAATTGTIVTLDVTSSGESVEISMPVYDTSLGYYGPDAPQPAGAP